MVRGTGFRVTGRRPVRAVRRDDQQHRCIAKARRQRGFANFTYRTRLGTQKPQLDSRKGSVR